MSASTPEPQHLTGRVRKYHSNFYYVEAAGDLYECALRGLIKKEGAEVLVGDAVLLDNVDAQQKTARIYELLPRKNMIPRPKMANVDQVIILYSLAEPAFDPHQMDRYLTHVELCGLTPIICISKADLAQNPAVLEAIRSLYETKLGFSVLFTSVHRPETLDAVRKAIQGRVTVLAGPSGSGKSSLLNALNPNLRLRVGEVSEKIARGQHTTRHVELLSLSENDPDTLIADTPGFSNLKFNTVLPTELERVYRDFSPYRANCAFSDCLHLKERNSERDCAVLAHLSEIAPTRYQSYLDMMAEAFQYKEETTTSSQKDEYGYKSVSKKGRDVVRILRLKDKDRDVSRRTQKQQVNLLETEESETHDEWDEGEDF